MVIFRVTRVWKGPVGPTFKMPACEGNVCTSFSTDQLTIGNELVVFASRMGTGIGGKAPDYFPVPCVTRLEHGPVDVRGLGRGRKPGKNSARLVVVPKDRYRLV